MGCAPLAYTQAEDTDEYITDIVLYLATSVNMILVGKSKLHEMARQRLCLTFAELGCKGLIGLSFHQRNPFEGNLLVEPL